MPDRDHQFNGVVRVADRAGARSRTKSRTNRLTGRERRGLLASRRTRGGDAIDHGEPTEVSAAKPNVREEISAAEPPDRHDVCSPTRRRPMTFLVSAGASAKAGRGWTTEEAIMDARIETGSSNDRDWLGTQLEIAAIMTTYGCACDTLSHGNVEAGRRLIKQCFTDDVVIEVFVPSKDPSAPPAYTFTGTDAWIQGALETFAGMGYTATQHHIGNVDVRLDGGSAIMKSYVTGPHIIDGLRTIDFVTATYTDHVVRTSNGWRIARRRLDSTSFLRLESTAPEPRAPGSPSRRDYEVGPALTIAMSSIADRMQIEAIGITYAYAADAASSRAVEEGRRLIKRCFTEDAVFESYLPGTDPSGPPHSRLVGPDAWADGAATLGYHEAQHHLGNMQIEVQGDAAAMKCCLTATLVRAWNRSIDLFTGTYLDRLVRTPAGWRIRQRKLVGTSFLHLESADLGDLQQKLDAMLEVSTGRAGAGQASKARPRPSLRPESPEHYEVIPLDDARAWRDRMEIEALARSYTFAADALGRGDAEEGRRLIKTCFTDDAIFEVFMPADDPDAPPALSLTGPNAWTEMVSPGFRSLGYSATQHHIGNVLIQLKGDTATMKCCLTATHIVDWTGAIVLATAIYTDRVVRTAAGFRIARRRLDVTSFLRLESPPRAAVEAPIDTITRALTRQDSKGGA
jgi:hypothetical protein